MFSPAAPGTIRPRSEPEFFTLFESLVGLKSLVLHLWILAMFGSDAVLVVGITLRIMVLALPDFWLLGSECEPCDLARMGLGLQ